jgi:hypothetical protein
MEWFLGGEYDLRQVLVQEPDFDPLMLAKGHHHPPQSQAA